MNTNVNKIPKSFTSDDAIFHYTGKDVLLEKILPEKLFKFSSLHNSNDPYEYGTKIWGIHGLVHTEQAWKEIQSFFPENTGYLAFCQNYPEPDDSTNLGCSRHRMWAQYGDNHTGACLVFSKEKLKNEILKTFPENDKRKTYFGSIEYKSDHELFNDYKSFTLNIGFGQGVTGKLIDKIDLVKDKLFFTKPSDYKGEREYRVITISTEKIPRNGLFFDISNCLLGITLGDRFPDIYQKTVNGLCDNLSIEYGKLVYKHAQWRYKSWQ